MIEQLRPGVSAKNAKVVLFDFDGTISLIRAGWMDVMVPMMVDILRNTQTGESEEDLRLIVEEFVGREWKARRTQREGPGMNASSRVCPGQSVGE